MINLASFTPDKIRNFSVIAHIDHGKSTLSDRLLERTGTISTRNKNEQFLDKLQVERERGITVKAQSASMVHTYNGNEYLLNLIDTPGHVDFSYEVSRSLYACQAALLLVDAVQGVQAQTIANFYLAFEQGLTIIPVINKIDLPNADPKRIGEEITKLFGFEFSECILASAKQGIGIDDILNAIVTRTPPPIGNREKPLRALLFDSWYDIYKGVISLVAIKDGELRKGDQITLAQVNNTYEVLEVGLMYPYQTPTDVLYAGQVGYVVAGMKLLNEARVGETIHHYRKPVELFPGFKPSKPMVFAGIFPTDNDDFELLQDAIAKLMLTDASVKIEKKSSPALGLGFLCGFLGLLHMDVFKQRLEQEYNLSVIITAPSVVYKVVLTSGNTIDVETPSDLPDVQRIEKILEPIITATIITPQKHLGAIMQLCHERRGEQKNMTYLSEERVILTYELPLNEVATDFYDRLKSLTAGYASMDYEVSTHKEADLVKLDILLNGKSVDAFSTIVHHEKAFYVGRELTARLRGAIPRQLFEVVIQAAIGAKIIARETISAMRKNVIAKCYGGDISRKRKLIDKQKEGKKRMKQIGTVEVPQEAFLAVLQKEQ